MKENRYRKNNAIRAYRDPFESLFGGLVDLDFGKIFEDIPKSLEYPYFRTVKSVGHVNLSDNDKEYSVEVSVPGMRKEDLNVELKENVLTITGEQSSEKVDEDKNYSRKEFSRCSFARSFKVPENVTGEVDAKLENGILFLGLKKKEIQTKEEMKKIEIK